MRMPTNDDGRQGAPTPDGVRALAAATGVPVSDERLGDVAVVLGELFELEAELVGLDLDGIEPNDDAAAAWEGTR